MNPKFSVVITVYNKEKYVERAIKSVLKQNFSDYEIIIIDDGSVDSSFLIAERALHSKSNSRLFQQINGGESKARNRGILEARGAIIAMLDADDEWHPQFLSTINQLATKAPDAGIYATGYISTYSGGFNVVTSVEQNSLANGIYLKDYFSCASTTPVVWSSAQAVPKCVYDEIGQYNEKVKFGIDQEMWGRIALKYKVAYDPGILARYRNDICGYRMVNAYQRASPYPPFAEFAGKALTDVRLTAEKRKSISDYRNKLLIVYADSLIAEGNREKLKTILFREVKAEGVYSRKVMWYRILVMIFPIFLLRLIVRFLKSRYAIFSKKRVFKSGAYHIYIRKKGESLV